MNRGKKMGKSSIATQADHRKDTAKNWVTNNVAFFHHGDNPRQSFFASRASRYNNVTREYTRNNLHDRIHRMNLSWLYVKCGENIYFSHFEWYCTTRCERNIKMIEWIFLFQWILCKDYIQVPCYIMNRSKILKIDRICIVTVYYMIRIKKFKLISWYKFLLWMRMYKQRIYK